MKLEMFHLMPYRELPADFAETYRSVWVDIPSHLFDPERANAMFNDTLDELELAATVGYDGVCVNEHHQNAYGLMPSPNIMAASLARRTRDVALIVLGNSIALYNPPVRVAEEFAMLDCISGGRLVAGFPVGSSQDTNFAYGLNPATLRDRYYEAEKLIVEAWTNPDVFAFNGKYTQLRYVNIWPRPMQQPHPPIWIPGGGSIETWGWCLEKSYLYAYLSYGGFKRGRMVMDGFWRKAEELGVEPNPYHAGFLQLVAVGESESQVEEQFGPHGEYFYNKMLHGLSGLPRGAWLPNAGYDPHGAARPDDQLRRPATLAALAGPAGPGQHHRRYPGPGGRAARARHQNPAGRPPDAAQPVRVHPARSGNAEHPDDGRTRFAEAPPPVGRRMGGPLVDQTQRCSATAAGSAGSGGPRGDAALREGR